MHRNIFLLISKFGTRSFCFGQSLPIMVVKYTWQTHSQDKHTHMINTFTWQTHSCAKHTITTNNKHTYTTNTLTQHSLTKHTANTHTTNTLAWQTYTQQTHKTQNWSSQSALTTDLVTIGRMGTNNTTKAHTLGVTVGWLERCLSVLLNLAPLAIHHTQTVPENSQVKQNHWHVCHPQTVPGNTAKSSQTKSLACLPHPDSPWKYSQIKSNQVTYSPPHQDSPWKHSQIKPGNTSSQLYRMESVKTFSSNQAASESQTKSCCIKLHPQVKPSCIRKSNQVTLHKVASISQTKWSCIQKSNQVKSNLAPSVEEELFLRPLNHDKHVLSEHNQHWKYIQSGVKVKNTSNLQVKYR